MAISDSAASVLLDAAAPYLELIFRALGNASARDAAAATNTVWRDALHAVRSRWVLDFETVHSSDEWARLNNAGTIVDFGDSELCTASVNDGQLKILAYMKQASHDGAVWRSDARRRQAAIPLAPPRRPGSDARFISCAMGDENDPVVIADMVFDHMYQHLYICDSTACGRVFKLVLMDRCETTYEWGTEEEVTDIDFDQAEGQSEANFIPSKIALFSSSNLALVFVSARDGRMVVLDGVNELQVLHRFSAHGNQVGQVRRPGGMALSTRHVIENDGGGPIVEHLELYVTDADADRIMVFSFRVEWRQPSTLQEKTASARVIGCSGDGPGQFREPCGVAVLTYRGGGAEEFAESLVVSERRGCRVQVLTLAGVPLQLIRSTDFGFPTRCLKDVDSTTLAICGLGGVCVSPAACYRPQHVGRVFVAFDDFRTPADKLGDSFGKHGMLSFVVCPRIHRG